MSGSSTTEADESSTDSQPTQAQSSLTDHETPAVSASDEGECEGDPPEFGIPAGVDLSTLSMSTAELEAAMALPYHAAADLLDEPAGTEPQFTGALAYDRLAVLTKHLVGVAHESRVAITAAGWYVSVVDPSNVVMVSAWLPAADWDEYSCDREGVIGLSWDGDGSSVSRALSHFSRGATIEISYDDRTVAFDDGIPFEFSTLDAKSTRQPPETPDLVLPNSVTLPGVDIDELTGRMDDVADHVAVVGQPDSDSVELRAAGDTAVVSKEYAGFDDLTEFDGSRKHDVFEAYIAAPDRSLLSLEYLRDLFVTPRKRDLETAYTFRFGDGLPVKIERQLGSEGFLRYLQAPRIHSE
jgi:DNA polymerase III sliding clamp (beta) subunit (PCNA family)